MSSSIEFHIKSYVSTAAIAAYVAVKKSGSEVVVSTAGDESIGFTMAPAAAGAVVPVRLLNGYGTALVKAAAAVTAGAEVSVTGSAGKIDDAGEGPTLGTAEEAATADGDIIEVLLRAKLATNAKRGVQVIPFPIQLAAMTTSAADLLTGYTPGFRFKILSVDFATTTIGAGTSASQVLNLEIGSTNVTGGVVTITLAGTDTLGELTAGTAVTAANTGSATDTISIEVAAGGTVFTAGAGMLLVRLQNLEA